MNRYALKIEDIRPNISPDLQILGRFANDGKLLNPSRAWVAKIKGTHPKYKLDREFLKPDAFDSQYANSVGSRGRHRYYWLTDGMYEISSPESWKSTDRYFCQITNGEIRRMSNDEVLTWAKNT